MAEKEDPTEKDMVALVPQEVREVNFYGDILLVALVNGVPYVALRPIVDFLGVEWSAQFQRIQRDDILNEEKCLVVMTGADGRQREMVSLPLELLPGWVFGISGTRLKKPEQAIKLKRYRRECFKVLWNAFGGSGESAPAPVASASMAVLQHARNLGLAVAQMAEEQLAMQEHVETIDVEVGRAHNRLDQAAEVFVKFNRRLTAVERRVMPYEAISSEQAGDIKLAVQRLGELLTKQEASASQDKPIKNYYSGIFTEIYNRTGAPRYELIRQEDYQDVMRFLEDWYQATQGEKDDRSEK
jgi:hypothetical protein